MADRFILSHVRRLPVFARLTPQQMDWVAEVTQILRYEPGEIVYKQGSPPMGMFMFISGSGVLTQRGTDGTERPFGQVKVNEFINEAALFSEAVSPMTLQIAEAAIVLFVARQQMQTVLAFHPDIKANLTPTAPPKPPAAPPAPPAKTVRENEKVLIQIRRHWWAIAGRVAWLIVAMIALWIAYGNLQAAAPSFPWITLVLLGTVALLGWAVYFYFEWQNDYFIITDHRVINIRQTIFTFDKETNEVSLDGIHEVVVTLPPLMDFVGRLLGYGTLIIKTSGDTNNMVLNQIPNPKDIQQKIFSQRKLYQDGLVQQQQNATRNAIKAEVNKFLVSGSGTPGTNAPGTPKPSVSHPGFLSLKFTNEKGETVYRKHHAIWVQHVILPGMLTMAGIILLFIGAIGVLLPLVIIVAGAIGVYLADWDWRNDLYIVGDQTIVIIHKRPLFLQDQKDQISLAQVDNIKAEVKGLFNTLLQMGEVKLLLTGTEAKNAKLFTQVYQPQQIQEEISRRQDRIAQAKRDAEAQRQRQAIVEYLSVYHETVQGNNANTQGAPAPQQPFNNMSQGMADRPTIPGEEPPPRVRDNSRPPGIPRIQRDDNSSRPG